MKKRTKLLIKDSILCTIFSLIIVFILSFLFINLSFFNPMKKAIKDFSFLDVYYAESFNTTNNINKDIVLINVEQRNRFELYQLIEGVKKGNPKVIGLDVLFKEKKDFFPDSLLVSSLKDERIITSYLIENNEIIKSDTLFKNNTSGFVNFNFNDKTNVIRSFIGIKEINSETHSSFSTQIAKKYFGENWKNQKAKRKVTHKNTIKYIGDYNSFMTFDFDEFMTLTDKSILKNKIVLLGYVGTPTGNTNDVEDKHFTPLNKVAAGKSIPDMFGVTLHANIISMLINNNFMFRVSNFWIGIFSFISMFLAIMYFLWLQERMGISFFTIKKIVLFLFTIVFMWLTLWLFKKGIVLKTAPIIGLTLAGCGFITYYKYLIRYIQKKRKWKSYFQ